MQKAFARLTALLLAVILLVGGMTGCSEEIEGNNYIELNGKKMPIPYAMKVGDQEVSMETYRYFFLNLKTSYFDYGDDTYWEQHPEDEETLKEYTANYCKSNVAAVLLAESYGLTMSEEEDALIDEQIETNKAQFDTEEAYQDALIAQYMTEDVYRTLLVQSYMQEKTLEYLFGEGGEMEIADEDAMIAENYVHVQHILIADKDTAQDVLDRAKSGEDFVALMNEYNEDPGETEEGYTFTTGEMVAEFEEVAFALPENEISDLVQTTYGYHIIKRLPLDETYIEENKETMLSDYKMKQLNTIVQDFLAKQEIEYSKYYDQFGVDTILAPEIDTDDATEATPAE